MDINYLYRISDAGNPTKVKLDIATKMNCLDNFIKEFKSNIYVFADNCSEQTLEQIRLRGIEPAIISLGGKKSWWHVVNFAMQNFSEDSYIYMIEDDYLHLPGSLTALEEGLKIADYVTLYDHSDKYINKSDGGSNPYINGGGELTRVLLTKSTHWKHTNSTTLSFATRIKTLKEDLNTWEHFTHKKLSYINDFAVFQSLTRQNLRPKGKGYKAYIKLALLMLWKVRVKKKRTLISPVPSYSTHAELAWLAPITTRQSINSWEDV